jgi:hypothetical protein
MHLDRVLSFQPRICIFITSPVFLASPPFASSLGHLGISRHNWKHNPSLGIGHSRRAVVNFTSDANYLRKTSRMEESCTVSKMSAVFFSGADAMISEIFIRQKIWRKNWWFLLELLLVFANILS